MKKNPSLLLLFLIGIVFLIFIFRQWILSSEIIGGDWPFFFNETLKEFTLFPPAWSLVHGNGLGGTILTYYLDQYLYLTAYLSTGILHIPWVIGYKLFWFGLFIVLSISSSIYLLKTIFSQAKLWQMGLAALIFTTNTYILMVVGGGQMGVALAYSIAPVVLVRFIKLIDNFRNVILRPKAEESLKILRFAQDDNMMKIIMAGLILAAQVMFDPRIAYLSMVAISIYALLSIRYYILSVKTLRKKILSTLYFLLYAFVIPIGIAILLHSYWIFPLLITRTLPISESLVSMSGFEFFSFADFSHALSLLHPNWPENIFGKIYFLNPEFLILPIIAFSALLFNKNKNVLFFVFLALVGAFLAKGTNQPLGQVNEWLFQYIPGMVMFRDSTKWYTLVAISYSILIPFSIGTIYNLIKSQPKFQIPALPAGRSNFKFQIKSKNKIFNPQNLFLILTTLYLIFLIRLTLFGQLGGTFKRHDVPKEYAELKDLLNSQHQFFRTLWIPRQQRFTFVSNTHPAIEAMPLFEATNSAQIISRLQGSESQRLLEKLSVKYVIIPYDSLGEIFLKNRKYDEGQYEDTIREIKRTAWLKKLDGFGKIAVFEVPNPEDHFWLEGRGKLSYKMISPTQYFINISMPGPSNLVFSENYSTYWTARIGEKYVTSSKTKNGLNSFAFNKVGKYNVEVFYTQEKYFHYGRRLSFIALFTLIFILFRKHLKRWL